MQDRNNLWYKNTKPKLKVQKGRGGFQIILGQKFKIS